MGFVAGFVAVFEMCLIGKSQRLHLNKKMFLNNMDFAILISRLCMVVKKQIKQDIFDPASRILEKPPQKWF